MGLTRLSRRPRRSGAAGSIDAVAGSSPLWGSFQLEYPTSPWQTTPSTERAARTLAAFRNAGVKVVVADPADDQWMTVRSIARLLSEDEIDVAIFHGPDFIHHAIVALSDVPRAARFARDSMPDRLVGVIVGISVGAGRQPRHHLLHHLLVLDLFVAQFGK